MTKRVAAAKSEPARRMATPFRIPKAAELVARQLRGRIIRGELKEGDTLAPEAELVAMFGVSRPTLREAVRVLESEGLISISRGARGGARVHSPDIGIATKHFGLVLQARGTPLIDVYKVRLVIEPAAARVVAAAGGKEAAPILRACLHDVRDAIDNDAAYGSAWGRFHIRLIEQTGIQTLILMAEMVVGLIVKHLESVAVNAGRQIDNAPGKRKALHAAEKLVDLIEQGDADGAETYWREHLTITEKVARRWQPGERVIDLVDGF